MNIKLEHVTNQLWISELEVNKTRTVIKLRCICFLMCRNSVNVLKAMLEKKNLTYVILKPNLNTNPETKLKLT